MFKSDKVIAVTTETYKQEVDESTLPVLVDFWGITCGPCRMIAPQIEQLAAQYEGRLKVVSVCVEENKELAREIGLRAVPTFLVKYKGKTFLNAAGVPALPQVREAVAAIVKTAAEEAAPQPEVSVEAEINRPSDKDRTIEFFKSLGITLTAGDEHDIGKKEIEAGIVSVLKLEQTADNPKVDGYGGFLAIFNFDKYEQFVNVGIWE